mgnify:CR=1 FL=1
MASKRSISSDEVWLRIERLATSPLRLQVANIFLENKGAVIFAYQGLQRKGVSLEEFVNTAFETARANFGSKDKERNFLSIVLRATKTELLRSSGRRREKPFDVGFFKSIGMDATKRQSEVDIQRLATLDSLLAKLEPNERRVIELKYFSPVHYSTVQLMRELKIGHSERVNGLAIRAMRKLRILAFLKFGPKYVQLPKGSMFDAVKYLFSHPDATVKEVTSALKVSQDIFRTVKKLIGSPSIGRHSKLNPTTGEPASLDGRLRKYFVANPNSDPTEVARLFEVPATKVNSVRSILRNQGYNLNNFSTRRRNRRS